MAEYIKREAAIEFVKKYTPCIDGETTMQCVESAIKEVPSADVVEVRHGEWEQNSYHKSIYYCSECGRHIEDGSENPYEHFPYCHCGAKMDGKDGEK